jgi:integrase
MSHVVVHRRTIQEPPSGGLRAGEVWALRRRDVDVLHRELSVRFALKPIESSHLDDSLKGLLVGHPKSAASRRRLSLPSGLVVLLEATLAGSGVRAPEGYAVARERADDHDRADLGWTHDPRDADRLLFVTPRGYPVRHNLFYKRVFKPAVKAALPSRLHALRFHDLRHTCAALSLAATPDLHAVKERLGHENIATTIDLYGKRVPSVDAALADAVGASIWGATAPALRGSGRRSPGAAWRVRVLTQHPVRLALPIAML